VTVVHVWLNQTKASGTLHADSADKSTLMISCRNLLGIRKVSLNCRESEKAFLKKMYYFNVIMPLTR